MDGDLDGTATVDMGAYEFKPIPWTVSLAGSGSGTVSGDGISRADGSWIRLQRILSYGTIVTLTASADSGSTFSGWEGPARQRWLYDHYDRGAIRYRCIQRWMSIYRSYFADLVIKASGRSPSLAANQI